MMGSSAHYLGHGAMVTFQWPTGQNFWNYLTDCPRAEQYVPDIERMIALLARSRAQKINLIAYSCGSPLLAEALAHLRARHPTEGRAEPAHCLKIKAYRRGGSPFTSLLAVPIMRGFVGGIAQLGERLHGMQEVSGSIPLTSTNRLDFNAQAWRHYHPVGADPRHSRIDSRILEVAGQRRTGRNMAFAGTIGFRRIVARRHSDATLRQTLTAHTVVQVPIV